MPLSRSYFAKRVNPIETIMKTIDEAIQRLAGHAGHGHYFEAGFLFSLRPYRGLKPEIFADVIDCLITLSPLFRQDLVPRGLIADSMNIVASARRWGLWQEGSLYRNRLINERDRNRLENWIMVIERTVLAALDRTSPEEVAFPYISNFVARDHDLPVAFIKPFAELLEKSEEEGVPETAAEFLKIVATRNIE
jgi:hypothetical protein